MIKVNTNKGEVTHIEIDVPFNSLDREYVHDLVYFQTELKSFKVLSWEQMSSFCWYIPKGTPLYSESGIKLGETTRDLGLNDTPTPEDVHPEMKSGVIWNVIEARYEGRTIWKQINFCYGKDRITQLLHP